MLSPKRQKAQALSVNTNPACSNFQIEQLFTCGFMQIINLEYAFVHNFTWTPYSMQIEHLFSSVFV